MTHNLLLLLRAGHVTCLSSLYPHCIYTIRFPFFAGFNILLYTRRPWGQSRWGLRYGKADTSTIITHPPGYQCRALLTGEEKQLFSSHHGHSVLPAPFLHKASDTLSLGRRSSGGPCLVSEVIDHCVRHYGCPCPSPSLIRHRRAAGPGTRLSMVLTEENAW